jgi:tetratricopeptide (TPR) repeat protein
MALRSQFLSSFRQREPLNLAKSVQLSWHGAAKLILESPQPNRVRAFSLFEYALEMTPADLSLRFDVAYAYGENSAEAASFFHYSQLLERSPQHAGALNNLGVAASRLEMETIAVSRYRAAEELGNTLASANVAYKLLGEGFTAEAKTVLDAALKANEVHDNVLEALGAISRTKAKDETTRTEIEKSVGNHRRLAASHGRALVEDTVLHPLNGKHVDGSWHFEILTASESTFTGALSSSFETRDVSGPATETFSLSRGRPARQRRQPYLVP